jgi:hypothetical protein
MTLMQVALDDKYRLEVKRIYLSGVQALVRLPMLQRERDRRCYGARFCRAWGLRSTG